MRKLFSGRLIILYSLFLIVGFCAGYYINSGHYLKFITQITKKPAEVMAQNTINGDTKLIFNTKYTKCNHTKTITQMAGKDIIGKSENEIKKLYPDWNISIFNNTSVVFNKTVNEYCPSHYIIKIDDNGLVGVYQNVNDKMQEIKATDIFVKSLSTKNLEKVKNTIVVNSMTEVKKVLSDLST